MKTSFINTFTEFWHYPLNFIDVIPAEMSEVPVRGLVDTESIQPFVQYVLI